MRGQPGYWTRLYSRRRALGAGTAAAAGLAVGCGSSDDDNDGESTPVPAGSPSATPTVVPKQGGRIVVAERRDPDQFDTVGGTHYALMIRSCTNNRLVGWKHGHDVHPLDYTAVAEEGLAAGWEQPDPTTLVFKVRPGVKFHDRAPVSGRELTAEDVRFTFDRLKKSGRDNFISPLLDSVEATDARTVRFKLKSPYAPFVPLLAHPLYAILASEISDHSRPEALVGTGPFLYESYQPGVKTVLRRNPAYFKPGRPYLDQVEYVVRADANAIYAGVRTKEIDIPFFWWIGVPPALKDDLVKQRNDLEVRPWLKFAAFYLAGRVDNGPMKDPRVRQAVSLALDRQRWIDLLADGDGAPTGGMPYMLNPDPWYLPVDKLGDDGQYLRRDLAKAKALLEAAGYSSGLEANFWPYLTGAVTPEVELIVAQMKDAGITLKIKQLDLPTFLSKVRTGGDYDGFIWNPHTTVPDFDPLMFPYLKSGSPANVIHVADQEMDRLLEKQRTSLDIKDRTAAAHDIQRRVARECYHMYEPSPRQFMLNPKTVQNFGPHFSFDLGGVAEVIWRTDV